MQYEIENLQNVFDVNVVEDEDAFNLKFSLGEESITAEEIGLHPGWDTREKPLSLQVLLLGSRAFRFGRAEPAPVYASLRRLVPDQRPRIVILLLDPGEACSGRATLRLNITIAG